MQCISLARLATDHEVILYRIKLISTNAVFFIKSRRGKFKDPNSRRNKSSDLGCHS